MCLACGAVCKEREIVKIQENKDWNIIGLSMYAIIPFPLKSKKTRIEICSGILNSALSASS